jgi:hypothetical protein
LGRLDAAGAGGDREIQNCKLGSALPPPQ